jgi:hypothetical protein
VELATNLQLHSVRWFALHTFFLCVRFTIIFKTKTRMNGESNKMEDN